MNIRLRLTIQFTAIVLSILVLFSISIYYFSENYRLQNFYQRLEQKALTTAKLLIEVEEIDNRLLRIIEENSINILEDKKVSIYNYNEELIYNSDSTDQKFVTSNLLNEIKLKKRIFFSRNNCENIGLVSEFSGKRFIIIASAKTDYGKSELRNLKLILLTGLLFSFLISFFAGLFFSGKSMKPILNVIEEVKNIEASHLDTRVNVGNGKDEIALLAITFNRMLERLEIDFQNQKQFISNISHEIRTPLTSLTGQLEVTLMKERKIEEYESILTSLLEDIKSLNSLTNGLLELANSDLDIHAFKTTHVRIDELILFTQNEVVKRNPNIKVEFDFDEFPEEEQKLLIKGNENLLKIAFINILDNAYKFSDLKKVDVRIGFDENNIVIKFIDKGIGIPKEEIDLIFEPFYRASNSKTVSGHGIGLSLVKKIIELHNGILNIDSQINKGTILKIYFPYLNKL